jgi:hypothetical protein
MSKNYVVVTVRLPLDDSGKLLVPEGTSFVGDVYFAGTALTALPDNLSVGGDLTLLGTGITTLPDSLKVGGDLNLGGTAITTLPENMSVGGDLYLGLALKVPPGVKVGGSVLRLD